MDDEGKDKWHLLKRAVEKGVVCVWFLFNRVMLEKEKVLKV
jgi:hypothetical protein